MATASDVTKQLVTIIENAAGNAIKPAQKAKLEATAAIVGGLGDDIAPLLEERYDVDALLAGISKVEGGAIQIEDGLDDIKVALKGKPVSTPASSVPVTGYAQ
ncbi:hypothetical protein [Swingsia samuiensis]|uniref:Uncharacterized protein n=1 Tax=Swingsia samuiensis TaxID=1293412 RepID=A0A4Y6UMX3_9PROT|nr:hypothetical protein [Swingsia samuiensis]QDH16512.1 hypothetical protein E3D00_02180 [Swingsia samuiensis]QDH17385.1 hypothetical protein E3D00_07280 [Swingsia samuiensis]